MDTYDGDKHTHCNTWGEFVSMLEYHSDDPRYRTIYAHNGAGWDWLSFLEWLIKSGRWDDLVQDAPIMSGDDLIALRLTIAGHKVTLCDSLLLLKKSLDECGRKFVGRGKVDTGGKLPEWLWKHDKARYWRYLHGDTELLYDVMIRYSEIVAGIAMIPRLCLTLPSTALRVFRTRFLQYPIHCPTDPTVCEWLRRAYRGGRVEVFRPGYYKRIRVYDVNSMYPAVMGSTPVPITGSVTWTRDREFDQPGVFHVHYNQRDRSIPPLLLSGGKGSYAGEGYYCTPELRRFRGRIDIVDGFVFNRCDIVFREYVNTLWNLRCSDRNGPLGEIAKHFGTDLYGKFGQKPERTTIVRVDGNVLDHYPESADPTCISEEYGLYRITEACDIPHEHVGIAATITSEARGRLWEYLDSNAVYCDTDSVHTTGRLPLDSNTLGGLKLEYEGEGVYAGKKLYALRDGVNPDKVRAKGIRIHNPKKPGAERLGCDLGFDGLRRVLDGSKVVCSFRSAPTFNNVIRGGRSCTFDPTVNPTVGRTRTVRRTS